MPLSVETHCYLMLLEMHDKIKGALKGNSPFKSQNQYTLKRVLNLGKIMTGLGTPLIGRWVVPTKSL